METSHGRGRAVLAVVVAGILLVGATAVLVDVPTAAFVLAALSGWLRLTTARVLSERGWRWLHAIAYLGWALCLDHGILAGPDTAQRWAMVAYVAGVLAALVGLAVRLRGGRHLLRRQVDGTFPTWRAR